tara:strand:- start:3111 stop:3551 length:441 start_codon:yes stop_codon:yes gene_type:complete
MVLGNMMNESGQQYVATKDDKGTWRILDTWHADLKTLSAEDDIPDDSPAVATLSEGQFIALIREAGSQGVIENATFGAGDAELEATILDKDQEIQTLNEQILQLKEQKSNVIRDVEHTEDYQLKEKAMANILKLVSMQDMSNLTRE